MDHLHAFRLYRGTSVERAGFSPPAESFGMKFWDTDEDAIYRWDGAAWVLPVPAAHDILSVPHGDTTPAAAVQGDLMIAQGAMPPLWTRFAHPGGALRLLESAAAGAWQYIIESFGNIANTIVRADGNAGIQPNRLAVGTAIPNQDGVIAQAETVDPVGGGGGTARQYFKNDGGQTKEFFMDDTGMVFEKAGIVEELTVTVGGAGDFATIQDAVDWFGNWIVKGACIIDVIDATNFAEAVSFAGILIAPGSSLKLQGDTRTLAGLSYVVGAICNPQALANGGTFNNLNRCTLTVNAVGDQITVSGGTVDPDFDDGVTGVWGDGDWVLVFGNDDIIYEREVNAILGANDNIVELKVALPAAAFPGGGGALDDASAICLLPNRRITQAAGYTLAVAAVRGVCIDGFTLRNTGASALTVNSGAIVNLDRIAMWSATYGALVDAAYSTLRSTLNPLSMWGCAYGIRATVAAQAVTLYPVCVDCTRGVWASHFGLGYYYYFIASHCTAGAYGESFSLVYAAVGTCRQCTTGYYASQRAYVNASASNVNNNGNGADYNPAISDAWGNNNGSITWS